MANHKSAIKRARQTIKRTVRTTTLNSAAKTALKNAREILAKAQPGSEESKKALASAMKAAHKAHSLGILKMETASRYIARLSKLAAKTK